MMYHKLSPLIIAMIIATTASSAQAVNNLVLPTGYPEVNINVSLEGRVYGNKTLKPLLIIPGWGLSGKDYQAFALQCSHEFQVHVIELPGYRNTASYPIPGKSYGDQIWTNAIVDGVHNYITKNRLKKPIVFGHFNTSTQVAIRLGLRYPKDIDAIMIAGGPTALNMPNMPALTVEQRTTTQDSIYSKKWFKTVTPGVWNSGNYAAWFYSTDSIRAKSTWEAIADNSLPVMIQYLEEFNSQDTELEIKDLTVKTIALLPDFSNAPAGAPMLGMCRESFIEPWNRIASKNSNVKTVAVANSSGFVFIDHPDLVATLLKELKK